MLYYLRRVLRDTDSAEDVSQDTWLTVYRDIRKLKEPHAFMVWLYRIARNKAISTLRGRKGEDPLHEGHVPVAESQDRGFSTDQADRIHVCLNELPAQYREILVLRFMQQMTYEQIAGVEGLSLGTVKSRLHYAKEKLRQKMEQQDGHE